jgi:hypothetical protein
VRTTDEERLRTALKTIVARIGKYREAGLGEQDTKASLIEPLLESLGWDVRDPEQVRREFRSDSKDNPVDYALRLMRQPRLLVEAKGLGEPLTDRKWVGQILGYAAVAGAVWCVLSDGDEYQIYNATAPVDASEKLLCRTRLSSDGIEAAAEVLELISRDNMEENLLETLWKTQFVDRKVRAVLEAMFRAPDKGIVRLIRSKEDKLTPREVLDSIRRLTVRVEPPPLRFVPARVETAAVAAARGRASLKKKGTKATYGVGLPDLIAAGMLSPPMRLFRRYKGRVLDATLRTDGQVEYGGRVYQTCSTAAENARATVTGRRMNTNGWVFWQFDAGTGKTRTLEAVRADYLKAKSENAGK